MAAELRHLILSLNAPSIRPVTYHSKVPIRRRRAFSICAPSITTERTRRKPRRKKLEKEKAMRLPQDKNDRVLFGALSAAGITAAVLASSTLVTPQLSLSFGTDSALAAYEPAAPHVYHAQERTAPCRWRIRRTKSSREMRRSTSCLTPPTFRRRSASAVRNA